MADGTVTHSQTSFLGGYWDEYAQGKIDDPRYKTAMAIFLNSLPREEGCWTRRAGFMDLGPTYLGYHAMVRRFSLGNTTGIPNLDAVIELTTGGGASFLR